MTAHVDWREDALVRLEKLLHPLTARLLRGLLPGAAPDEALPRDLCDAATTLREAQGRFFDAYDFTMNGDARTAFADMAGRLDVLAQRLGRGEAPFPPDDPGLAFEAALEGFLDAAREAFLGVILVRQAEAQAQAKLAAREVMGISRQAYFISINAAVEAARLGAAGQGMAAISGQIRALSAETAAALRRMGHEDGPPPAVAAARRDKGLALPRPGR